MAQILPNSSAFERQVKFLPIKFSGKTTQGVSNLIFGVDSAKLVKFLNLRGCGKFARLFNLMKANFTDQNPHRKNALLGGDRIKFGVNLRRGDFAARFY
ncbi:hypothetical protein [Campylobacter rectus]|uniref:hypothetical protein n=1 Tax=Campylobacter rectus TaxID=203 RepID=UPI0028E512A1|nr:hypothetical protein [Campylobacter rectus]